jgi:hypothetical protein
LLLEINADSTISYGTPIGRLRQLGKPGKAGTTYQVISQTGEVVATIFYEKAKKRVFIRTLPDDAGREFFLDHEFNPDDMQNAVAYLVDYGYL